MNRTTSLLQRLRLRHAPPWTCSSCARAVNSIARRPTTKLNHSPSTRRHASHTSQSAQEARWENLRQSFAEKNQTMLFYGISIILGTTALSYGSVPMYKMICQTTGWGGQPIKAPSHGTNPSTSDPSTRLHPITTAKRIRITFNGSVSDILPWKFVPQQREVRVLPGETALAFYTATNSSKDDIIGVATYSVTPGQVAPYFSKIQCFCFEEQRLNAGETVDMPVFFYIDPEFVNDPSMRGIEQVTLSYTFFKAKYDKKGHLSPMAPS